MIESIKNKIEHADVFDITKEVLKQSGYIIYIKMMNHLRV